MAIRIRPKDGERHLEQDSALAVKLASSRPWIVSGLTLANGTGLNASIVAGLAWINGYVVELDAAEPAACAASQTNHIWLELAIDGNDLVTGLNVVVNTTGTPPSGPNVKLGTATTDGSAVTGTATTGRSPEVQVATVAIDAEDVSYDNATSGLLATEVQAAIDELAGAGGGDGYTAVKGQFASLAITNQTTPQDTDLTVALEASSEYFFELDLFYDHDGAQNNINSRITVPSGATGDYDRAALYYSNTVSTTSFNREAVKDRVFGTTYVISNNVSLGAAATTHIIIKGSVTTGVTAGDLKWQFAQVTSNGTSPVRLRRGSSMRVKKVS